MMKRTASLVAFALHPILAGTALAQNAPPAGDDLPVVPSADRPVDESASYTDDLDPNASVQFQRVLAPYGDWSDDPRYGRVWTPSAELVGADFSPYATGGAWTLTQYGWTWSSEYPWGWAPFHYGRWVRRASGMWTWVPGTTWGPAWVAWRVGHGHVGWAPLPPAGTPPAPIGHLASGWHFTPARQLGSARPGYLAPAAVTALFPRTTWFNPAATMTQDQREVRYNPGPVWLAGPLSLRVTPVPPGALPHPEVAWSPVVAPVEERPRYAPVLPPIEVASSPTETPPYVRPGYGRSYRPALAGYPSMGSGQAGYSSGEYAPPGYPRTGYGSAPPTSQAPGYSSGGYGGFVGGGSGPWGGGRRGR
jgi:hypothetical protein